MTITLGDKVVNLPTRSGIVSVLVTTNIAEGDKVILFPTPTGHIALKPAAISPGDSVVLVPSSGGKLIAFRTGEDIPWVFVQNLDSEEYVMSMAYLGNNICVAGTYRNGCIYRSTDGGLTWSFVTQFGYDVSEMVSLGEGVCLANHRDYLQGTILRSIDYGATWGAVSTIGSAERNPITYLGNGICIAGGRSTIHRSSDYGVTWTPVFVTAGNVYSLGNVGAGICLAGTIDLDHALAFIYRSTDYGVTWNLVKTFSTWYVSCQFASLGGGTCLAGTGGPDNGKLWKSIDYGATWELKKTFTETYVWSLFDTGGGSCYLGTALSGNIYKTRDWGNTWALEQDIGVYIIYVICHSTRYLLGTAMSTGIWRRT